MFSFIKKGLDKTLGAIKEILPEKVEKIDKTTLEEILIESDIPYELIEEILYYLPPAQNVAREDVRRVLKAYFKYDITTQDVSQKPFVELVIGVNGAGKTTTIAKLAHNYKKENQSVLLGAADTFRAAALNSLKVGQRKLAWASFTRNKGMTLPLWHTIPLVQLSLKKSIMLLSIQQEDCTIKSILLTNSKKSFASDKALTGAPHRKILILDGTQGTSAINQAKAFHEMISIDAIIITKLDGTAKGGSLFGIAKALELPIIYVGVGEGRDDLIPFNADDYIDTILDSIFTTNNG